MNADTAAVKEGFNQWAIVELLGHVRIAGHVTEAELFGSKLGRIDIPNSEGGFTTQYFSGNSIYRLTPTTEEIARAIASRSQPAPIHQWELPKALKAAESHDYEYAGNDEDRDFRG